MRKLTAAVALALVLTACGSGNAKTSGISARVDSNPFRISLVENGKTVVSEDKNARLRYEVAPSGDEYQLTKVISSRGDVYTVATSEHGRTATVVVQRRPNEVHVTIALHPSRDVEAVYDAYDAHADDHFLGGGEQPSTVDLRGQIVPVEAGCTPVAVPYVASSAGWGLALNTQAIAAFAFPGSAGGSGSCSFGTPRVCSFPPLTNRVEACAQGAQLDERLYAGNLAQTLHDYEAGEGKPRVPPESELALIKWRDVAKGPQDLLQDIAKLQAARIPIGWELLDNPWESCVGSLTFDPKRFPNPEAMIQAIHARGVRMMLWVSPLEQCDNGYPRSAFLGDIKQYVLDLRSRAVTRTFTTRLAKLVRLGVDGFKADRGDEVPFDDSRLQNAYPLWYAHDVMSVLRGRPAIFRAGGLRSQTVVPGIWASDQEETWAGFAQAIRSGETAAMSGFPTWGSDVGGYDNTGQLTADLFARWAQLGAISPIMEVGGQGANATPWRMGARAMSALRAAAVLHYELAPLFEALLANGEPILRPLAFAFPEDAQAWANELELMVGTDLLAAPVTGPGTTSSIYLPPGSWIDLHTGRVVKGPSTFTRVTPLDQLPLFVRAGAVVPFDLRTADSWWGVNELSHPGRAGYLVTPGATVDLRDQPHDVQLWVPAASRPSSVTVGGKSVSFSWNAGAFPGVVVRVHGPVVRGAVVLHP
jgi:alpha-D-xyloside xylohydrolase